MSRFDRFAPLFLIALLGCAANTGEPEADVTSAASALRESSLSFDVTLRGSSPVKIHAHVWSGGSIFGATVLAVHGLSETGATYGPLATAILNDRLLRFRVRRVIAIDMPGHGESAFPDSANGVKFGDLAIEDYVGVVIDSIRALRQQGYAPSVLIGHSMGGLEVQAAQETLLAQSSSLARLGIRRALLLAPVPPHGNPWTVPPSGDLSPLIMNDPERGAYLQVPPEVFIAQSFGKRDGTLATTTPSVDEVVAAGYIGPEPVNVLLQLVEQTVPLPDGGSFTPARPRVREDAFRPRNGTTLELASFSQDLLVHAEDLALLYPYLTGDDRGRSYDAVVGDDAVHGMFVADPAGVLDELHWP
jgi:pimeloyl-ACP methyl ester carboxylesterase